MSQLFTATDFVKALSEGGLHRSIVREGMVKLIDGDQGAILFSEGTTCQTWVRVPLSLIERVEYRSNVRCQEHEHPFVRLHLKAPADNPAAELFANLLLSAPATAEVLGEEGRA